MRFPSVGPRVTSPRGELMDANALPVACSRCGSQDVQWLGQTDASVFVTCGRCSNVWRLDPPVDRDRRIAERTDTPRPPAHTNA
jgi:hypothetical protein